MPLVHLAMLQRRMFFTCWNKWGFIQVLIKKKFFLLLALSRRRSAGLYLVIAFKLAHKSKTFKLSAAPTVIRKEEKMDKTVIVSTLEDGIVLITLNRPQAANA